MPAHETAQPSTIDEYIAGFPADVRAILSEIRRTIRDVMPAAGEAIKYRIPTFVLDGNVIHFAAFRGHIGIYPAPRGSQEFGDELDAYAGGKGTLRFPLDAPIPFDLIRRVAEFRLRENRERAAARKPRRRS